jgi:hypothetical protein
LRCLRQAEHLHRQQRVCIKFLLSAVVVLAVQLATQAHQLEKQLAVGRVVLQLKP